MAKSVMQTFEWVLRYAAPTMLIGSWLIVCGCAAHWDMPIRTCNASTGYCGKSGAAKSAADYDNSQKMNGIIVGLWAVAGIGMGASRLAADRISSIPTAKERATRDLRT